MKKITSEDIIYAALSLFSEKGYDATSVDEIARKSGMVKASFYKYFQSKEELLLGTIVLIEKLLDADIKELYLKHQLPSREKLRQLYLIALGRIYKNKVHLLVYSVPLIGSKEEKIAQAIDRVEHYLSNVMVDFLIDAYGQSIRDYAHDINFVIKSIIINSFRMSDSELSSTEHQTLAEFIVSITDILAQGMLSPDVQHQIMWGRDSVFYEDSDQIWTKGKQISYALQRIDTVLKQTKLNEATRNEYVQILSRLQRELSEENVEIAHVKALLLFLGQLPELLEDCTKLKAVLEI
ncbi:MULTISPECIES: TetR/AcrR family transcriptional regulator [Paenibacillus]|jgi:AcrR family transcriptional regulator|uniref:Helix-turn-helix domain containing protein n=1 Tax=Paenibacillus polymyxa TaxID=1406 RepID=A0AAJ3MEE5_PAEPO|nr:MULTISPECIES: TetR/AcrR family transcriptional regulator [Paenibacillus]AHC19512.1 transcriptional regulator [Paenibacillus polymyxa CR1]APQ58972.1 transcriptional regulator [Paenibacillus polymyxa]MBP1175752.1 AcrR family transcriptional regulator [Paenibacillus sp. PvR133]MDH2329603.1 helix-turn-helix domain containing protein [Paenibacillus polymyxa]MXO78602.1 TetR family transcriptional regulator [Paenibacillus sp. OT2-17]